MGGHAGVESGVNIRLAGEGGEARPGGRPGNMYIYIEVRETGCMPACLPASVMPAWCV